MVIASCCFSVSYMHTTLYFSFYHINSIAMFYLVHEYKKNVRFYKFGVDTFVNSVFASFSS